MEFDFEYAWDILPTLLRAAVVTIQATFGGMALALVVGLVLVLLVRSRHRLIAWPSRFVLEFVRGTPLLIQLFFIFYVLPDVGLTVGAFTAGVLTLGLHYGTYVAEVYRAGIEGVPAGQWEASVALSLSRFHTWTRIVLPQAIRLVLPMLGNLFIAIFKETPLLATITVLELLGAGLQEAAGSYRYLEIFTLIGLIFLALSLPTSAALRRIERRGYAKA